MSVLIGTPAYGGMVHTDFVTSILPLGQLVDFTVMFMGNQSLITRARNEIFSYFVNQTDFDHLLFLDADIGIKPRYIRQMVDAKKPFMSAAVPLKGFDNNGNLVFNYGKVLSQNGVYASVDRIGTAVMLISRELAKSVKNYAIESGQVYYKNKLGREDNNRKSLDGEMYNVFDVVIDDGDYLSEDYYFCKLIRKLGYEVLVDATIPTRHNGNYVFTSEA